MTGSLELYQLYLMIESINDLKKVKVGTSLVILSSIFF